MSRLPKPVLTPGHNDAQYMSIYDTENPCSIINLVPDSLKEVLYEHKDRYTGYFHLNEAEVRNRVKPDERDERLRLNFWDEYNYATQVQSKVRMQQVMQGVCSVECWYQYYLKTPMKIFWMITPPKYYSQSMKYILNMGLDRMIEMMSAKVVDEQGKLDVRAAGVILKAFHLVDLRVKGAIAQKVTIDQRTMNLNADINAEHMSRIQLDQLRDMSPDDLLELERRAQIAERASKSMLRGESPEEKQQVIDIATNNTHNDLPTRLDELIDTDEPEPPEIPFG